MSGANGPSGRERRVRWTTMTSATGTVAAGWEPVRAAFEANLAAGREVGAAVAVYHRGRPVVSLAGGSFDEAGSRPYTDDTLQLVFSTTKGIAALAVALCVERGLLDYDAPVVDCWPEFGAAGKERITVAPAAVAPGRAARDRRRAHARRGPRLGPHGGPARRAGADLGARDRRTATTPSPSAGWPASWSAAWIRRAARSVASWPTS